MNFEVGAGMTPQQQETAQQIVTKPVTVPLPEYKTNTQKISSLINPAEWFPSKTEDYLTAYEAAKKKGYDETTAQNIAGEIAKSNVPMAADFSKLPNVNKKDLMAIQVEVQDKRQAALIGVITPGGGLKKTISKEVINEAEAVVKNIESKWMTSEIAREKEIQLSLGKIAKKYRRIKRRS